MKHLATLGLIAVAGLAAAGAQSSSDSEVGQTLRKMEQTWVDAAKKKDVAPLEAMLADDFTLTNPVGQVVGKATFVEKVKDGTFKIESMDYSDVKIRVYGTAAVATGKIAIKATWDDNDVGGDYAFTDTFVKQDGNWKEVAEQVTRTES